MKEGAYRFTITHTFTSFCSYDNLTHPFVCIPNLKDNLFCLPIASLWQPSTSEKGSPSHHVYIVCHMHTLDIHLLIQVLSMLASTHKSFSKRVISHESPPPLHNIVTLGETHIMFFLTLNSTGNKLGPLKRTLMQVRKIIDQSSFRISRHSWILSLIGDML